MGSASYTLSNFRVKKADQQMKPELQVHSYDESEAGNPVAIKELTNWLTSTVTLKVSDLEQQVKKFHYVTCTDRQRLELLDWIRPLLTNTAYSVRAAIDLSLIHISEPTRPSP